MMPHGAMPTHGIGCASASSPAIARPTSSITPLLVPPVSTHGESPPSPSSPVPAPARRAASSSPRRKTSLALSLRSRDLAPPVTEMITEGAGSRHEQMRRRSSPLIAASSVALLTRAHFAGARLLAGNSMRPKSCAPNSDGAGTLLLSCAASVKSRRRVSERWSAVARRRAADFGGTHTSLCCPDLSLNDSLPLRISSICGAVAEAKPLLRGSEVTSGWKPRCFGGDGGGIGGCVRAQLRCCVRADIRRQRDSADARPRSVWLYFKFCKALQMNNVQCTSDVHMTTQTLHKFQKPI